MTSLQFQPLDLPEQDLTEAELPNPGRPISAVWNHKTDDTSGVINFQYLVDASGRYGLMSTKYLKNRRYNEGQGLKNIAIWGYWENAGTYGVGTNREGWPYFEALQGCFPLPNSAFAR